MAFIGKDCTIREHPSSTKSYSIKHSNYLLYTTGIISISFYLLVIFILCLKLGLGA